MIQKMIDAIGACFPLTELGCGEYAKQKVSGMNFTIRRFYAEGIGNVSSMVASGFFGLMKMDTLIITPTQIDMPLLSYDRVLAMGNDTLIYELYDTYVDKTDLAAVAEVKAQHAALPDHDLGEHWYDSIKLAESISKKGKKMHTVPFDVLTKTYMDAFLADCAKAPACDGAVKREKASVYVEGLLSHGGPSTDVFKKALGEETTAELFRNILFGTAL